MPVPVLLWIGDNLRPEFATAWASLAGRAIIRRAADMAAARRQLEGWRDHDAAPPELIVVAQAYPGQVTAAELEPLRRAVPLARIVALLGSWCEGEARSGQPWPAAERVYWHQWGPRFEQELARLAAGQPPLWSLPVTASDDERLLAAGQQPWTLRSGAVAIVARSRDVADFLADACRRRGYTPLAVEGPPQAMRLPPLAAALWDGSGCDEADAQEIAVLSRAVAPAPVLTLLNFPRVDDVQRALSAGAAAVLSKPIRIDELLGQIERLSCIGR